MAEYSEDKKGVNTKGPQPSSLKVVPVLHLVTRVKEFLSVGLEKPDDSRIAAIEVEKATLKATLKDSFIRVSQEPSTLVGFNIIRDGDFDDLIEEFYSRTRKNGKKPCTLTIKGTEVGEFIFQVYSKHGFGGKLDKKDNLFLSIFDIKEKSNFLGKNNIEFLNDLFIQKINSIYEGFSDLLIQLGTLLNENSLYISPEDEQPDALKYLKDMKIESLPFGDIFSILSYLYKKGILDNEKFLELLDIYVYICILNYMNLNFTTREDRMHLPYVISICCKKQKDFSLDFKKITFNIIRRFFDVDFPENISSIFLGSNTGRLIKRVSCRNKQKIVGGIILSNYRFFFMGKRAAFTSLVKYLTGELSTEKYESIKTFFSGLGNSDYTEENILFLFENDLENYYFVSDHSLIFFVKKLFISGALDKGKLDCLDIDRLRYIYQCSVGGGSELETLIPYLIENPKADLSRVSKNNSNKPTTSTTVQVSENMSPNVVATIKDFSAILLEIFGKECYEVLDEYILRLCENDSILLEVAKILQKIGEILDSTDAKDFFVLNVFESSENGKKFSLEELEGIYRILDFFSLHNIKWDIIEKIFSLTHISKDNIDYIFKKLKPNKLPPDFFILDYEEFKNVVFHFLEEGDESIINFYLFPDESIIESTTTTTKCDKLVPLSYKEVFRKLRKKGFTQLNTRGKHITLTNPNTGRKVSVGIHSGKDIPPGTLAAIIFYAGIDKSEWHDL